MLLVLQRLQQALLRRTRDRMRACMAAAGVGARCSTALNGSHLELWGNHIQQSSNSFSHRTNAPLRSMASYRGTWQGSPRRAALPRLPGWKRRT